METALNAFKTGDFTENALSFFETIGYKTEDSQPLSQKNYAGFASELKPLNEQNALVSEWIYVDQLFFLTPENTKMAALRVGEQEIHAYMIFGIELKKSYYSRSDLAKITRELNRKFDIAPILVLFKHGDALTLSVINRRLHKRDESRDVLEKVTLIKDIRLEKPHRAHLDILGDLAFSNLKPKPTNFVELHNAWQKVLNTKTLNKQFYEKLFDWYLFALSEVKFPQIRAEEDLVADEQHQSESLIRLLTRLLFVWFMKEKGLINPELFEPKNLKSILKNFTGENSNETIFYKAILQNLFFATLNMPIDKRKVIYDGFARGDYGNQLVYRYAELFNDADFKIHFDDIPFLNGGLFDCLDQRKTDNSPEIRLDGFSTQAKKQAITPDKLFFGEYKNVDLSAAYDNKKKSKVTVYGLIDILQNHKFTVEENTPLEEDIALDPELLGQVFENLLAAYNPETGTTARKQTGSFYTPREIVDYMVDESLLAYFESTLNVNVNVGAASAALLELKMRLKPHLRELLNYENSGNPFDPQQTELLINAIDNLKILDPACGSGAFPMGILHKLVFVLSKLDPKNEKWRDRQIAKLKTIDDSACREKATQVIHDAFENNELDYGRKLFLIENCIHGVDIQPIATQISKLRFFISLIVDQKSHGDKANNFGIRPLPNLDFKIIAANTLIAAPQDDFENNALFSNDSFFENFSDLTHDYFKVANPDDKRKLRDKIETLINAKCDEKIKAIESLSHNEAKYKKQIDQLESHKKLWQSYANLFKHEAVAFFEPRYFFPQLSGGFDIVIGNPPYVQIQKFSGQAIQTEWQNQHYETFQKTGDIYALFIEKGVSLLKQNGLLAFITSNKWMRAIHGKPLQKFLAEKTQLLKLIDFGDYKVFDAATVNSNILITQNSDKKTSFNACAIQKDFTIETPLADYFVTHSQLIPLSQDVWVISSGIEQQIKAKIEAKGIALKDWDVNINYGIKTGFNEAFIIDTETKERLCNEDPKSAEIIKPILRGRDIKRYSIEYAGLWIIATFPALNLNIDDYPAVRDYLKTFGKRLEQTGETGCRKKTNNKWFEVQDAISYKQEFEREKIIWLELTDKNKFSIDNDKNFVLAGAFLMTGNFNYGYVLSFLNSKIIEWYFDSICNSSGTGTNQWKKFVVEKLPIPKIPADQQQPFIKLVDKILAEKKAGNDTSALEREIDVLVYGLYGLSDEEILIVEGGK